MYYYRIVTGNMAIPIKTNIGPDIELETALEILRRTNEETPDTTNAWVTPVTDPTETSLIDEQLPIRITTPRYTCYIRASMTDRVTITMVRYDPDGQSQSYADNVTLPRVIADMDCSGEAVKDLLIQIAKNYAATEEGKSLYPDEITWNDIVNLPEAFLAHYGVTIDPIDTYVTIDVNMNEEIA